MKTLQKARFGWATFLSLSALLTACQTINETGAVSLNCDLQAPPVSSGELAGEGGQMRIYPRSTDMPKRYSGCQTAWGEDRSKNEWVFMAQTRFVDGSVTELRSISSGPADEICKYSKRALVAGPASCPRFATANKREASLPPGCLDTVIHSKLSEMPSCFKQYQ